MNKKQPSLKQRLRWASHSLYAASGQVASLYALEYGQQSAAAGLTKQELFDLHKNMCSLRVEVDDLLRRASQADIGKGVGDGGVV